MDRNNITIDPTHKDKYGRPSLRMTYRDHDDDLANARYMQGYAEQMAEAAGAVEQWSPPVEHQPTPRTCSAPAAWATIRPRRSSIGITAVTTYRTCSFATARAW